MALVYSPEWEDDESADEEDNGEDEEEGIAGLFPSSIGEHLSRLKMKLSSVKMPME